MIVNRALEKARLWRWSRNEMFSEPLRAYYRKHFSIDVGMYSYGCFDPWRWGGPSRIGRYCSVAKTAYAVLRNHPYSALSTHPAFYESSLGVVDDDLPDGEALVVQDDVWIGHHVVILPGCKFVGRGAIIGAGAIVTKNVPAYTVVAGNPARPIKDRFSPELVKAIEESRWWKLSFDELREAIVSQRKTIFSPTCERLREWRGTRGNAA